MTKNIMNETAGNQSSVPFGNPEYVSVYMTAVAVLCLVVGLLGNVTVMLLVLKGYIKWKMLTLYIFNLSIADTVILVVTIPAGLRDTYASSGFLPIGIVTCTLVIYMENVAVTASVLTMLAICANRYKAVMSQRIRRNSMATKKPKVLAVIKIISIWAASLFFSVPYIFAVTSQSNDAGVSNCGTQTGPGTWQEIFVVSSSILLFFLPAFIILCAYSRILVRLRSKARQRRRHQHRADRERQRNPMALSKRARSLTLSLAPRDWQRDETIRLRALSMQAGSSQRTPDLRDHPHAPLQWSQRQNRAYKNRQEPRLGPEISVTNPTLTSFPLPAEGTSTELYYCSQAESGTNCSQCSPADDGFELESFGALQESLNNFRYQPRRRHRGAQGRENQTVGKEHLDHTPRAIFSTFIIITFFFLCILPYQAFIVFMVADEKSAARIGRDHPEMVFNALCILRILFYLNSTCNPAIYNASSGEFRTAVKRLYRC